MWEQLLDNAVQLRAFTLGNAPEPHCSGLLSCLFLWKLLSKEKGRQTNTHRVVPGAGKPSREPGFRCCCGPGADWAGCSSRCDPSTGLWGAWPAKGGLFLWCLSPLEGLLLNPHNLRIATQVVK